MLRGGDRALRALRCDRCGRLAGRLRRGVPRRAIRRATPVSGATMALVWTHGVASARCWGLRIRYVGVCSTSTACSPRRPRCTPPPGRRCSTLILRDAPSRRGQPFVPFDPVGDYDRYVDGKPPRRRHAIVPGVPRHRAARRAARTIRRRPTTVSGLGNRKNEIVLRDDPHRRRRGLRGLGPLRAGRARRRAAAGGGVVERQLPRRAGRGRASTTCSTRASTASSPSGSICAASPRRTRSWPAPRAGRGHRRRPRCSRTPWPGSRPAGPAGSASSSAWTGWARPTRSRQHGADVVVTDLAELLEHR